MGHRPHDREQDHGTQAAPPDPHRGFSGQPGHGHRRQELLAPVVGGAPGGRVSRGTCFLCAFTRGPAPALHAPHSRYRAVEVWRCERHELIVQVKTPQIGSELVAQLNGLVHTHGADYGLPSTWSGLSQPARDAVKHQRFRVKVWHSTDIVEAVLRNYEKLPEDITERLPLRRVWMLKDA